MLEEAVLLETKDCFDPRVDHLPKQNQKAD
jgi:hypothetical protein